MVIDRLITDVNSDSAKDGIEITLNGDGINMDSPVVVNGETLVPIDFLRYFTTEYNYNKAVTDTITRKSESITGMNIEILITASSMI